MKKPVLVISLVTVLAVGVPSAVWVWESVRPAGVEAARDEVQGKVSPFVRMGAWVARKASGALEYVVTAGLVRRENEMLRRESGRLKVENAALREALKRYERLDAAAEMAEKRDWRVVAADVVAYGPSRWPHGIVVNRGADEGVATGDPVLHLTGLVGVVLETTAHTATVQTLTSPQSAIGVLVLPSRARGVVRGLGRTDRLELTLEDPEMRLQPGQQIISSGAKGSLYPVGLDVGVVSGLGTNRFGQDVAEVHPSTSFSRVEEVLILVKGAPGNELAATPGMPSAKPDVRAPEVSGDADTRRTTATEAGQ